MKVTTTEANSKGLPESFENVRRIIIEHGDLKLEVTATLGEGLVIRGIADFSAGIIVVPEAPNSIKVLPSTAIQS